MDTGGVWRPIEVDYLTEIALHVRVHWFMGQRGAQTAEGLRNIKSPAK